MTSTTVVRAVQETIAKATDTACGLSPGVWTERGSRIMWMADQLRCDVVWGNTFNPFDPTAPFGGYKESGYAESGYACQGGRRGLEDYVTAASTTGATR